MACGTPIIAWRRGSLPEIVEDDVTGFIVESEDEAIDTIERVPDLNRRQVRAAFERRSPHGRTLSSIVPAGAGRW
jgi:glycosyltransferase involved in cell wall biosynthesis